MIFQKNKCFAQKINKSNEIENYLYYKSKELRLKNLREKINLQIKGGFVVFGVFWIPGVFMYVLMLAVITGSYFMIQTFIKDRKYGWLAALAIFVFIPLVFNFYKFLGYGISTISGLLPVIAYLFLSMILKFVINDWIEETHFKALRFKEQIEKNSSK